MRSTGNGHGAWCKSWRKAGGVLLGRRAAGVRTRRSWSVRFACRFTWSWRSRPLPGDVRASGEASCGRSGRRLPDGYRLGTDEVPDLPPEVETGGDEVSGEPRRSRLSQLPVAWAVLCGMPIAAVMEATAMRAGGPSGAPQLAGAAAPSARCSTTTRQRRPSACATVTAQAGEGPVVGALPSAILSAAFGSGHIVSVRTTSSASARSSPMSSRTARSAAWPGRSQAERPRVWSSVIRPSRAASTASLTRGAEARP